MDARRISPSKKRKRLDSHGSLADISDVGSGDGNYTPDSHDVIVTKSRIYKKKQMKKLGSKSSAEMSNTDSDGDGRIKEKKNKDSETSAVSKQSKYGNGSSDITGSSKKTGVANNLPMSPTKSSVLLRRQYRRERTSSQSSTGTDNGNTSLSQIDYFPLSGLEQKNDTTEEERNAEPKHTCSPQKSSAKRSSASGVFPWISSSQESDKDSQPPIRLDADGLLMQEDIFKKPLEPVKYCSGLVSKSGKKKRRKKGEMSDDTSGVETDTSTSASTVQSAQEDSESGNEKRRKKKKKKKEKDKDVESNTLENQATNVSTIQSADDTAEDSDEKRHKKKKKKREKDKDLESDALEYQATSDSTIQSADDNIKESDEKRHKKKKKKENDQESNTLEGKATIQPGEDNDEESGEKKHKKKKKKKDRDVEDTSDGQSSVSRIQTEDDNAEGDGEKRHKTKKKKKKNKDAESSTLEMQVSQAEDSDIIPPSQELSKPEKYKKKHKKKTNASDVNGEKVVPCSQDTTLNGNVSSESQNASNTDTGRKKKKKKSKEKRSESAYTSQSESEVPESDVDPPVDSPLPLPRRHAIEHNVVKKAGTASKDKPKSTANKLPVWCIEDAGQESQTVSEVFDLFGWGQNKPSSSGARHSSMGMIRTTSSQPNFDRVVGKEGGTGTERRRKDKAFEYQSHDETAVTITPQKKSKLSRKGKQTSDKGKTVNDREKQAQSSADGNAGNNGGIESEPVVSGRTKDSTAKEDAFESVDDSSSKVPSKPAQENITERRKGTKRVKKGGVSEEAKSAVDNEHAEKRRKIEHAGKQQGSTEKQNSTEEVDKEINPKEQAHDQAIENCGDKRKLSKKGKQKSAKGKAVTDGEKQQQSSADDSADNDAGTEQGEAVASERTGELTAEEDSSTESRNESSSKVPSKPTQDNITKRRKGTKRVKKEGVSEEAESTGKKHAEKRRKIESARKQQDTTEKQNPTEEVAEEVNPEETTQDQAREDPGDGDQDDHSSGDEFQDAVPSTSTGARSSSRVRAREARRRKSVVNSGDTEDLWLKGVQALSAEDVQRLREKGVTIKFGHFSRQEIAILKKNMESFCEIHGVEEPRTLLYPNQYEERKTLKKLIHEAGLFRHLAQGLDRPLWNVYTRARYMYSNAEVTGKWTPKEHKKLMQLYEQHGPRWALISKSLGRFEDNIKQRFRHTRRKSMGRWSAKESRLLIQAVQAVTGKQDVTNITSGISWQACSDFMNNVRNGRQCHNHWLYLVNWFFFQQGGPLLSPQQDIQLIDEIYKSEAEVESDIDWKALAGKFSWVKHQGHLRRRWHRLKLKVPDWNRKDMDEILDYLKADLKKKADSGMKPRVQREAKSGPFIFTSSEESSDDEDEDDDDTEEEDNNLDGTVGDDEPTPTSDKESSKEENTGQITQDKKSDGESSDEEDDDTEEGTDLDDTVGDDKPTTTSDKESSQGKDTGQITQDKKSDDESSEEDDTDDDSETEVDTSDEE
ncbi:uncharacterized protein LOC144878724 isoform X2 [Branchiostoma floridae x Branchiostoma japonicum]